MVQQLLQFDVETTQDNAIEAGKVVEWYLSGRGYWRTGVFIRTVERGRRFGLIEIRPTAGIPKKRIFLGADLVRPMATINYNA